MNASSLLEMVKFNPRVAMTMRARERVESKLLPSEWGRRGHQVRYFIA